MCTLEIRFPNVSAKGGRLRMKKVGNSGWGRGSRSWKGCENGKAEVCCNTRRFKMIEQHNGVVAQRCQINTNIRNHLRKGPNLIFTHVINV